MRCPLGEGLISTCRLGKRSADDVTKVLGQIIGEIKANVSRALKKFPENFKGHSSHTANLILGDVIPNISNIFQLDYNLLLLYPFVLQGHDW